MLSFNHIVFKQILNTYKSSFSGLAKETWLLSAVMLLNRCGSMAVPFMGLYITQNMHRSATDAGLIITLFGLGAVSGSLVGGKLTDLFGFRLVQITSAILAGLFFLIFPAVEDFSLLCVLSVVISFFSDAFRPANFTAIAYYAKPGTVTRSYSLNRLATNIGWSFGISLAGIIASLNYHLLFLVEGSVLILVGLSISILLKEKPVTEKPERINAEVPHPVKPWKDTFYIKFIFVTTLLVTCAFLMFRVMPVFLKEQWRINEFQIGLIMGLNGAVIALFEMILIGKIEQRRSAVFFITVGATCIAVSYLLFTISAQFHLAIAIAGMLVFTIGEMFALPFINTIIVKRSNDQNRGMYAAGYSLSWSLAQVIGPLGGFYLANLLGYNMLWYCLALLLVLSAYGFSRLGKQSGIQTRKI